VGNPKVWGASVRPNMFEHSLTQPGSQLISELNRVTICRRSGRCSSMLLWMLSISVHSLHTTTPWDTFICTPGPTRYFKLYCSPKLRPRGRKTPQPPTTGGWL